VYFPCRNSHKGSNRSNNFWLNWYKIKIVVISSSFQMKNLWLLCVSVLLCLRHNIFWYTVYLTLVFFSLPFHTNTHTFIIKKVISFFLFFLYFFSHDFFKFLFPLCHKNVKTCFRWKSIASRRQVENRNIFLSHSSHSSFSFFFLLFNRESHTHNPYTTMGDKCRSFTSSCSLLLQESFNIMSNFMWLHFAACFLLLVKTLIILVWRQVKPASNKISNFLLLSSSFECFWRLHHKFSFLSLSISMASDWKKACGCCGMHIPILNT
jgi:hypothetical protein